VVAVVLVLLALQLLSLLPPLVAVAEVEVQEEGEALLKAGADLKVHLGKEMWPDVLMKAMCLLRKTGRSRTFLTVMTECQS